MSISYICCLWTYRDRQTDKQRKFTHATFHWTHPNYCLSLLLEKKKLKNNFIWGSIPSLTFHLIMYPIMCHSVCLVVMCYSVCHSIICQCVSSVSSCHNVSQCIIMVSQYACIKVIMCGIYSVCLVVITCVMVS